MNAGNSLEILQQISDDLLQEAKRQGADAAEIAASENSGLDVTVRMGDLETVEHTHDRGFGVTVWFGQCKGSASTSDFTPQSVRDTIAAACAIARYTAEDPCSGLPPRERLAWEFPDLDLDHPWTPTVEQAAKIAQQIEDAARATDARITNSEGGSVSLHRGVRVHANSLGMNAGYAGTRHSYSCAVIAEDDSGMQRDYWYHAARKASELPDPEAIGRRAAERSVRRLQARRLQTTRAPILFEAPVAISLLRHFSSAISGGALYRKTSFLVDQVGNALFPEFVKIHEEPLLHSQLGSAPFDGDGVATQARTLIESGVLQGYALSQYSACRLGLETTGNAGGLRNLRIEPGANQDTTGDLNTLIQRMGRGLLVTELMGQGVNMITGDYSRGVSGFWIENGEIAYPVEEVTIAGNLKDMFKNLQAVGSDMDLRGSTQSGSILLDEMSIAGS
jgi:PmbA protein